MSVWRKPFNSRKLEQAYGSISWCRNDPDPNRSRHVQLRGWATKTVKICALRSGRLNEGKSWEIVSESKDKRLHSTAGILTLRRCAMFHDGRSRLAAAATMRKQTSSAGGGGGSRAAGRFLHFC